MNNLNIRKTIKVIIKIQGKPKEVINLASDKIYRRVFLKETMNILDISIR